MKIAVARGTTSPRQRPGLASGAPVLGLALVLASSAPLRAQEAIEVGGGSYASFPIPGLPIDGETKIDVVAAVEQRRIYRVTDDDRPVPSNKWYQNLLFQQYGTALWALPHKVDATKEGIEISLPNSFSGDGVRSLAEFPIVVTGRDFKPIDSRAKDWTDWTVSFRSYESETRHIDVTLGEGMPAVWCEFTGVQPLIAAGGQHGKSTRHRRAPRLFGLEGQAITLPFTGPALGLIHEGRAWGVFAPDGTRFEAITNAAPNAVGTAPPAGSPRPAASAIAVTFAGTKTFLVLCPLSSTNDLARFQRHAYAVPRDTELAWNYDRDAGQVTTTWTVRTEPLQGTNRAVLQGWLPHHWRDNNAPLALDGPAYTTIRGPLRCAAGERFTLRHVFQGVVPNYPAVADPTADAAGRADRVRTLLTRFFQSRTTQLAGDTYGAGKDLQRYAQAAFIAEQTKDPSLDVIRGTLRRVLENWLTYTPGERARFFAWYPKRKGLVGFPPAFGSQHFTDTHFHQGYFVYAAALLCQLDPGFAASHGGMVRLLALNYANSDRAERRFPRFRTFDPWRGHSFADGNGSPDGNNQESTGEAINSWAALIFLGEALNDPQLTATGVMGYTFESRANLEYWFDPHDDVFPPAYAHQACGMVWSGSIVWGTWFTASPAWIYGIQWLPSGPHLAFHDRTPDFIPRTHAEAMRELAAFETREATREGGRAPRPATIDAMEAQLASYHLGYLMHADAPRVAAELDRLWNQPGDKVAHDEWMMSIHYQANQLSALGRVDWTARGSSPTSMAYRHPTTGRRTFIAWNPAAKPQTVTFREGTRVIGTLTVPPHATAHTMATAAP